MWTRCAFLQDARPSSTGYHYLILLQWQERTVLFIDALELDFYDTSELTPNLLPGNIDRELRRAYTAFSSPRDDD